MKASVVHSLRRGEVKISNVAEEILSCQASSGLLVCALKDGVTGAFYITERESSKLEALLETLLKKVDGKVSVKLIGSDELRLKARQWFSRRSEVSVTADVAAQAFELYVYVGTGRVRMRELDESEKAALAGGADVGVRESGAREASPRESAVSAEPAAGSVRVLIVDDSKTIRNLLRQVLSSDPAIQVVGEAERPSQVEDLIEKLKPTVITLDINMPEMDGVTLLSRYLPKYKIPTVMVTAISMQDGDQVLRALNLGAVDYIQKPSMEEMRAMSPVIIEKIKVASSVSLKRQPEKRPAVQRLNSASGLVDTSTVVAIGASTGGVQALDNVFSSLPESIPPVVVVQHIPPVFSAAFAKRLNDSCPFEVLEAKDGDEVKPNRVLIAAGGTQMKIERKGAGLVVRVFDGAPVNRHKPSVDVLFDSVAEVLGRSAIGVILTGMGADGAKGLLKMRQAGARTVAQDKDSCVVFGMPRAAIELGAAEEIKPLHEVPETILRLLASKRKAA
jgi:two-component system chemotaxis response regulator CheB